MVQLRWHEPASYRRAVARRHGRAALWESCKFALVVFSLMVGIRALDGLGRANPNLIGWTGMLVLAASTALLVAFGLPAFLRLLPNSIVILSEKGINNNIIGLGASIRFWPWGEISSCGVSTVTLDGKQYRTLVAYGADGRELASFGLSDSLTLEEIQQLLKRYGKRLHANAG